MTRNKKIKWLQGADDDGLAFKAHSDSPASDLDGWGLSGVGRGTLIHFFLHGRSLCEKSTRASYGPPLSHSKPDSRLCVKCASIKERGEAVKALEPWKPGSHLRTKNKRNHQSQVLYNPYKPIDITEPQAHLDNSYKLNKIDNTNPLMRIPNGVEIQQIGRSLELRGILPQHLAAITNISSLAIKLYFEGRMKPSQDKWTLLMDAARKLGSKRVR